MSSGGGEDGARESGLLMIASVVVGSMPHLTTPWLKVEALRLIQKAGSFAKLCFKTFQNVKICKC